MEPINFGTISTKKIGRVTIDYQKGIHLIVNMEKMTLPRKLIFYLFIKN